MEPVRDISYGVCHLQLKDGDLVFLTGDERFAEITGYQLEEVTSSDFNVKKIIAEKERKNYILSIRKQLEERSVACLEVELIRKDFQVIYTLCCMDLHLDKVTREEYIRTLVLDVTQDKLRNQRLEHQVQQDTMTGLYNKQGIEGVVNRILEAQLEQSHAFYLIDIDNFKHINDTFGHVFGDTVIQDVAATIRKEFPTRARIGRIGGDEFVAFLPGTDRREAKFMAESVLRAVRREIAGETELVSSSCSMGITMWQPGQSYQDLVKCADAAMYFSKDSGKNQFTFYQDFMEQEFHNKRVRIDSLQRNRVMSENYDVEFVFFAYQLLTDSKQFDSSMNLLMERTVEHFGLDRCSIFEYQGKGHDQRLQRTNSGVSAGAAGMGDTECTIDQVWLEKSANSQGDLVIYRVEPGVNTPVFSNYVAVPKSFVMCIIREQGEVSGCVSFCQYQRGRQWTPYEVCSFHELAKAIAVYVSLRRDKKNNLKKIHLLSTRDKVTGLLDQKNFERKLEDYIRHCRNYKCLALVYVDINNFSYVNERYGTGAGDELLCSFAKLLNSSNTALLAGRLFSDCFLGLHLNDTREQAINKISEGHGIMSELLRRKYPVASLQFKWGVYFLDDPTCSVREAIENANMARKSIKEEGNTNYAIYNSDMRQMRTREQQIIVEFLEARRQDTLELYFQPSFHLEDGKIRRIEAFCRWHNKQGIQRLPVEIIPVLKQNGYILEWDMAVYEKALIQIHEWQQQGKTLPPVEVNFSTTDFHYTGIVDDIVQLARDYQVDPGQIVIELSEHGLRKAPGKVNYVLHRLKEHGFLIAIDNFGNTYASMGLLLDESVDFIKTGCNLLSMGRDWEIRSGFLQYLGDAVRTAKKEIVLVGAERQDQEQKLREYGYHVAQGYLYQCELPAEEFHRRYLMEETST